MATMNISLPDQMRDFVESELVEGGYTSASEYFRELVRQRQRQRTLERLISEGETSGPFIDATPEYFENRRKRLLAKLQAKEAD